jgi:PAS domain S-box-containing protein
MLQGLPHDGQSAPTDQSPADDACAGEVLRSVLDEGSLAVAVVRPVDDGRDFIVVYSNAAFQALRPEAPPLAGRRMLETWPDIRLQYLGLARRVLESGEPWIQRDIPLRHDRHPDPAVVLYHTVEISRRIIDGQPYLVAIAHDTTTEVMRRQSELELALSKRLLEAHIDNSPLAVVEFDGDLRVTRWSAEAARLFGWQAAEVVGRTAAELPWVHEADAEAVWRAAAGLRSGGASRSASVNRNYRKDGSIVWCEWYNSSVYDDDGHLVSILSQIQDITERRTGTRLRDAVARIDAMLHSTLDQETIMDRAVRAGAQAIEADTASLCLLDGGRLVVSHVYNWPAERIGTPIPGIGVRQVQALSRRRATVIHASSAEPVAARYMREWDAKSLISLPLVVRDQPLGVLYLVHTAAEHEFGEAEMVFGERLASSLSLAIENARLYEAEHRIAETLQEALLVAPSRVSGVTFARGYEAATGEAGKVGGDFVDIFEVRDHVVAVALGDVSGKGLDAAVTTSFIRDTLRVHALEALSVDRIMMRTNEVAIRFTSRESFATIFFGLLDTRTGRLRYVSAGHPPGVVVSRDGSTRELAGGAPVLGVFDGIEFPQTEDALREGDRLVIYSDGVIEARSPARAFLGGTELLAILSRLATESTDTLCAGVLEKVRDFSQGELRDDAAVLVVEPTKLRSQEIEAQLTL